MISNKFLKNGKQIIASIVACEPSSSFADMSPGGSRKLEENPPSCVERMPKQIIESVKTECCSWSWNLDFFSESFPEIYENQRNGRILWYSESVYGAEMDREFFMSKSRRRFGASETKVWNNSVAFQYADIGGFLAVNLSDPKNLPVVLLNPNRKAISNCAVLGNSLEEFLDHWSRLAFLSPSEKSFAPFSENFTKPLNADCDFAKRWLEWLTTGVPPKPAGKGKR